MISFLVNLVFVIEILFLLQIITLCSVIVIMFVTETMLYPYFIHVHIFMMSLCMCSSFVFLEMPCQVQTACREISMSNQVTKKADNLAKDCGTRSITFLQVPFSKRPLL